jgi:hypothetical protein
VRLPYQAAVIIATVVTAATLAVPGMPVRETVTLRGSATAISAAALIRITAGRPGHRFRRFLRSLLTPGS